MLSLINSLAHFRLLLANTGWMLSVEVLAKVTRIVTIVCLAAGLSLDDYGTAMLAMVCHEVFKLLLRSGTGAQVIQCAEHELENILGHGQIVQWLMSGVISLLQVALAFPIGAFYDNSQLTWLLISMAPVYLIYPLVSARVFVLYRSNALRQFSWRNGVCIVTENLATALVVLTPVGIYSVAVGKWVFALTWLLVFLRLPAVQVRFAFERSTFSTLMSGTTKLIGTELARALRIHLDVLIAGRFLSPELFGLYSFAKNAGVGLTNSISQAYTGALYPYLCATLRKEGAGKNALPFYALSLLVGCVFVAQAMSVPYYVPMLFDVRWADSYLTTATLCLVAVPAILVDTRCAHLRSQARFGDELRIRIFCVANSVLWLSWTMPYLPFDFALALLQSSATWLVCLMPFIHWSPTVYPFRQLQLSRRFQKRSGKLISQ